MQRRLPWFHHYSILPPLALSSHQGPLHHSPAKKKTVHAGRRLAGLLSCFRPALACLPFIAHFSKYITWVSPPSGLHLIFRLLVPPPPPCEPFLGGRWRGGGRHIPFVHFFVSLLHISCTLLRHCPSLPACDEHSHRPVRLKEKASCGRYVSASKCNRNHTYTHTHTDKGTRPQ